MPKSNRNLFWRIRVKMNDRYRVIKQRVREKVVGAPPPVKLIIDSTTHAQKEEKVKHG